MEELIKKYKEFLEEFDEREREIYRMGGTWNRTPDFKEFMDWLMCGFISKY